MAFGYKLIANFLPNMCFNFDIDYDLADLMHTATVSNIKAYFFNSNQLFSSFFDSSRSSDT